MLPQILKSRWQLDLLLSGWAIAYKGRTLKNEWSEHIQRTKAFLLETLTGGSELHVLGAGRLLDFPLLDILDRYQKIHFYDGDSGAVRYLRKSKIGKDKIIIHLIELTGELSKFKSVLNGIDEIQDIFKTPEFAKFSSAATPFKLPKDSHIVSLNLLSQLPLAYRQIFERWILKIYGQKFYREEERSWLDEYNYLAVQILRSHLGMLNNSNAEKVVLISDTEQLFYPISLSQLPLPKESSFAWEVNSSCSQELEVTSSICGLQLKEFFTKYQIGQKELWPWHLAPATNKAEGIVCRVEAVELGKIGRLF